MLQAMLAAVQDMGGALDPATAKNYMSLLGAGIGIGRIGDGMTQGIARQPEAAASIQTAAIILAALIEGVALFGLVIALLFLLLA